MKYLGCGAETERRLKKVGRAHPTWLGVLASWRLGVRSDQKKVGHAHPTWLGAENMAP